MSGPTRLQGPAVARGRLDAALAEAFPDLSRSRATALVKEGVASVDGEVVTRPSAKVRAGQLLCVDVPAPTPMNADPQDLPLRIVDQDADLVIVDKDPGRVVHPGPGHPDGTLVNALLHHVGDLSGIGGTLRPGIVHRLDRGTSGLLVVAKHDLSHRALAAQFAAHTAQRLYLAIVHGAPREAAGTVRSHLARHPKDRMRWASTPDETQGKPAVTHWRRLGVCGDIGLVQCQLETGRTHQVRVHMRELGHPLVGDTVYGRGSRRVPARIREAVEALEDRPLLHAWSLSLDHPSSGDRRTWLARPPRDFMSVVEGLELVAALPERIR